MTLNDFIIPNAALVAWRECRGGGSEGMRAVLWSIYNRVQASPHYGVGWLGVIYKPLQYSSMTFPKDPQLATVPADGDPLYAEAVSLVTAILDGTDTSDPTHGATSYWADSIGTPYWAVGVPVLAHLGGQTFVKAA